MCRSRKYMSQAKVRWNDICASDMVAVERKGIELYYRPKCRGILFDVHLKFKEVMK